MDALIPEKISLSGPRLALFSSATSRQIESHALSVCPPMTLMRRAAHSVFRLGLALYPHARKVWVACGPGNNGGDGWLAASLWHAHFQQTGGRVVVTWVGDATQMPPDAAAAMKQAREAGVEVSDAIPEDFDLAVDALLGLGVTTPTRGTIAEWCSYLQRCTAPVLCVDLPSGLHPDTGEWLNTCPTWPCGPRHTLSLLTLKPGLFTASGRETCGDIWWDDLGATVANHGPDAYLYRGPQTVAQRSGRHTAHKGTWGDVTVIGGQSVEFNGRGMTGAALLAGRAAAQAGAGRVYVGLVGQSHSVVKSLDDAYPELMFRTTDEVTQDKALLNGAVVCGCGGGEAVRSVLPQVLMSARKLVLDADALNVLAQENDLAHMLKQRSERGLWTVLTPHPLEAARLLQSDAGAVQQNRLLSAQRLAEQFQCIVVLKGSGTVIAVPGITPCINASGNALLATAGTGDVLAGLIGAAIAADDEGQAFDKVCLAVYRHGLLANQWPPNAGMTAHQLLEGL